MTAMPIQREQFFRGCTFLLFVGMSWTCADGGTEPPADPPQPTTVALTPASATLTALGASLHLIADVRDQYGQVMSGTTVSWTSNSVQVASVDGVGVVTAVANGSATITATVGSATAGADITVAQVVSAVTVSATSDTLAQGYTLQFAAEGRDANGHAATAAEFSWASSDTTVSKVDQTGLATGVGPGRANIVAVSSGVAGQRALQVMAPLNSDREALRALYQATNGANWLRNHSWLTERPLGNWSGVQVDGDGRVVRLQLNNNNLIGRIPPELGLLDRLETLVLRSNTLTGTIPSELGGLDSLRELVLFGNDLTGQIPPGFGP